MKQWKQHSIFLGVLKNTFIFIFFKYFAFHFLVPAWSADISFLLHNASTGYIIRIYTHIYIYIYNDNNNNNNNKLLSTARLALILTTILREPLSSRDTKSAFPLFIVFGKRRESASVFSSRDKRSYKSM